MNRSRYAADMPLLFSNTQLPPTRSDFSKQSNAMPRSCSALAAVIPDEPAPIRHTLPRARRRALARRTVSVAEDAHRGGA